MPELTDAARKTALRKAYGKATARLREDHREAFNALYSQEAALLGVEWKPKPSTEEKAREELAALLTEHPDLFEVIDALRAQSTEPPTA